MKVFLQDEAIAAYSWFGGVALQFMIIGLLVKLLWRQVGFTGASGLALACAMMALLMISGAAVARRGRLDASAKRIAHTDEALRQTDELFAMAEMLQSADSCQDATAVLMATASRLLPGVGGALYILDHSRDRLDLAGKWDLPVGYEPDRMLLPDECRALRHGTHYRDDFEPGSLGCATTVGDFGALEIPMMARGKVYGLFMIVTTAHEASPVIPDDRRLGQALADSMALALANITLREDLRTQALRDPLTGLYNRRYMVDALARTVSLAERAGDSTAVLMIDLDDFKQLNDQHGHAMGDAVLRDVARQLVSGLRPADIVCRYGGEELLVIMPECTMAAAMLRAETLRASIRGLSETYGATITASFGVAANPESSTSSAHLVPMADAALYRAKRRGKNCVVAADAGSDHTPQHWRMAPELDGAMR